MSHLPLGLSTLTEIRQQRTATLSGLRQHGTATLSGFRQHGSAILSRLRQQGSASLSRLRQQGTTSHARSFSHSAPSQLGGYHQPSLDQLPVVYHPEYSAPQMPSGHRFPMSVFKRIHDRLLEQGIVQQSQIHIPGEEITDSQLTLVHCPKYLEAFNTGRLMPDQLRRIGFGDLTSSEALIRRTRSEVAGTLLTARLALDHGLAVNTAGGTHHAFPDFGSGFCILNDLAVTTEVLLKEGLVKRVLILDLDVHQGDGTAYIFRGRKDVFTLSFHCQSNFPSRKQESTMDVGLPDKTDDAK
eukprot:gene26382-17476_t